MRTPVPGEVVHIEYTSSDLPASRAFLQKAFGWTFQKQPMPPGMEYWTFETPGGPPGGVMAPVPNQPAGTTMSYILVRSLDDAVAKAVKSGAVVCVPKREVPSVGWFSIIEAPGQVQLALWETSTPVRAARPAKPRARPTKKR
jgi:predicted enzyme related to lactoylglutathione lyase